MILIQRRKAIKDMLLREKAVKVSDLAKKFGVSEETIRRDLTQLEEEGLVERNYGGEAVVYVANGDIPGSILDINGYELSVKEYLSSFSYADINLNMLGNIYYIVVDNIATINKVYISLAPGDENITDLSYYYGFDTYADSQEQIDMVNDLNVKIWELDVFGRARGAEASRSSFYSLYGGLFFLGIFLGILFVMATVLIIYYKQIVEGYDDKERFEIMQKVGMSREEIKGTIRSQVLTVFFLPLMTAVIHIAVAFKVITKLLLLFGMTNVRLFATCTAVTIIVFAFFYTIIYALTARTYYKIVS